MIAAAVLVLAPMALISVWLVQRSNRLRAEDVARRLIATPAIERLCQDVSRQCGICIDFRPGVVWQQSRDAVRTSVDRGTCIRVTFRLNREPVRTHLLESAVSAHASPQ